MAATTPKHNIVAVGGLELWKTLLRPNTASTHLTLWAALFGSHLFHGFIGGPTAFMAVPRQTFGLLQSKIFPVYFGMGTVIPAALIANLAYAQGSISNLPSLPLATLVVPLVANAVNWFYLGPKATDLMFARHAQEKKEGVDAYKEKHKASPKMQAMSKQFARLHGISSLLNLASFAALIVHGSSSQTCADLGGEAHGLVPDGTQPPETPKLGESATTR
ncbi:unnamed protein product [Parajaminaea phylloscopi]